MEHQKLTALQMQAQQWQAHQQREQWAQYQKELKEYEVKMEEWRRLHGSDAAKNGTWLLIISILLVLYLLITIQYSQFVLCIVSSRNSEAVCTVG